MRLIDADAMCADLATVDPRYKAMIEWGVRVTEAQPTVDAVEVVRCKDCKWASACYGDIVRASKGGGEVHMPLGTDGYCSFAERREDVQKSD